jgi:hypothetical protein
VLRAGEKYDPRVRGPNRKFRTNRIQEINNLEEKNMIANKRIFLISVMAIIAAIAMLPAHHHLVQRVHAANVPSVVILRCSTFNGLLWAVSLQETGPGVAGPGITSFGTLVPFTPPNQGTPCDQVLQGYLSEGLTMMSYGEIRGTGLTDDSRTQVSTWTFQGIPGGNVQ